MIRHLVFLKFPANKSRKEKLALFQRLSDLREHLPGIADFGHRPNLSPETAVTHDFTDMFWVDFKDESARDAYLADPTHQAVGADLVAAVTGGTQGTFVCDIEL